jgi:hypothetical protein
LAQAVCLIAMALTSLLAARLPALADREIDHSGLTGRHRLADLMDSPGAVCDVTLPGRDTLGETWLRVNPPVMFARDRTPRRDEQLIGWRATVSALNEYAGVWRVVRRSAIVTMMANDDRASYFDGRGWVVGFPFSRATYTVTIEMLWYDPTDSRLIEGRALHAVDHYLVVLRANGETTGGRTSGVCRSPR